MGRLEGEDTCYNRVYIQQQQHLGRRRRKGREGGREGVIPSAGQSDKRYIVRERERASRGFVYRAGGIVTARS